MDKYTVSGFAVGFVLLPVIVSVVGGAVTTKLAKKRTWKNFGKGMLTAGVVGVGVIAVATVAGVVVGLEKSPVMVVVR